MRLFVRRARCRLITLGTMASLLALPGCAALPLAGVGTSALGAGAGVVVKVGTDYSIGGTIHRTFTIPLPDVRDAVLEALGRTGVEITEDEPGDGEERISGTLHKRGVSVGLTALSGCLTSMSLAVKRNVFSPDRATTSELLEQVEQVLAETPRYARRLRRERDGVAPAQSSGRAD